MSLAVWCPTCGRPYNLTDDYAGKTVRCRDCGEAMTVPAGPSFGNAPQYAVLPPAIRSDVRTSDTQLRPARPRRRSSSFLFAAGIAACGLVALTSVAGLIFWGVYSSASRLVAANSQAAAPPAAQPVVLSGTVYPAQGGPAPNAATSSSSGSFPPASSRAEQATQNMLAKMREINALLAQIVDAASLERLRDPILKALAEGDVLKDQLDAAGRFISRSEDHRLTSIYLPQFTHEQQVAQAHWSRIRSLGRRLQHDEEMRRFNEIFARAPTPVQPAQPPVFQPPQLQPPSFQPPAFAPGQPPHGQPTNPRPSIPKPSFPRPSIPRPSFPGRPFGR